jgi:DNA polymerase III subunit delta'
MYSWQKSSWRLAHSAIARGAHALLVAGPRGSGKRDFGLALAAAYLCSNPNAQQSACGQCESCRWIAAGTHPDLAVVEPIEEEEGEESGAVGKRARFITIDQVRQLSSLLSLSAHRSRGKAIVVHPAEELHTAASNALLKGLEEPPAGVLFLLVAHRPALLLPTVRSRCHLIPVRVDDRDASRSWLASRSLDGAADADLLLALAGGAPLQAAEIACNPLWTRRAGFLERLSAPDADPIGLAELYRDLPPALLLAWLQTWTFDLIHARFCGGCRYHQDLATLAAQVAVTRDPVALTRLHRHFLGWQRVIHHPLNPRLLAEQLLTAYCDESAAAAQALP